MKSLLLTATLLASPVYAGGPVFVPNDPVVTRPADTSGDWTGPYVGLSAAHTSDQTSRQECYKDRNGQLILLPCDNDAFTEFGFVPVIKTITTGSSGTDVGAFAGYRHDFGRLVGGVEIGRIGDVTSAEVQLGLDMGRVLPYGLAGGAWAGGESGTIYGAGVDVRLGQRWLVGIKHTTGDVGGMTTLRVGIRF